MESGFLENIDWKLFPSPEAYVTMNAEGKVAACKQKCPNADMIIGSDTVVTVDQKVLEKPSSRQHAKEMLQSLSGKNTKIFTAVNCQYLSRSDEWKSVGLVEEAGIDMIDIDDDMIEGYLELGNGMDNAGALAVQDGGLIFCKVFHGDYHSAVGFPMTSFYRLLTDTILPDIQKIK